MNPGPSLTPAKAGVRAGLLCRCPHCGKGPLFTGFLKVVDRCAACGFDFTRLNTGDGAAIFIMQIAGGIVVFGALFVQVAYNPPIWAMLLAALPLVAGLSLGLMRPGKGVMIALQMRSSPAGGGGRVGEADPTTGPRSGGGGQPLVPTPAVGPLRHPSDGPPPLKGEE
ncbi:DUF983 domain-containing protein [Brevundimonas sp.]|uniref:DUF983 domain-containing protein n=1 Tax=Brevundimonas sp. TaxID=1871086 RepID=UPI003520065D